MYGNILNNKQILNLIDSGEIKITPFNERKLQTIHYPLNIKGIARFPDDDSEPSYHLLKKTIKLEPNEYVTIDIDEHIELCEGIIGEFTISSNLIEKGISLTCGKIDSEYGKKGESIIFGLKNLLNKRNSIEKDLKIAYIKFYDLRALDNNRYKLSKEEMVLWKQRTRRFLDDGPNYYEDYND